MVKVVFEPKGHTYFDENGKRYPSVTELLSHFGMSFDYEKYGNEASRNFGVAVHRLCELYDKGCLGEYDKELQPYLDGYKMFLDAFEPRWELIEKPMIHSVWKYAGTPDRVGKVRGAMSCIDIKTGSGAPAHELQTSAYAELADHSEKIKVRRRYSLILLPNDFRLIQHKEKSDRSVFIGLAQAFQWKTKHKLTGGKL